jgi:hypothetical protein|tara:strand:+ start:184 stop:1359 length:1176 start_codon:yes stop_codon:yes gene_type:complete
MVNEFIVFFNHEYTFLYYIFELANYSFLALIVLLFRHFQLINNSSFWTWLGLMFTPIVFNYFLFDADLFGDQTLYTVEAVDMKLDYDLPYNPNVVKEAWWASTSMVTAKILSFIPLPMLMTVTSLAFANKLILFLFFVWASRFMNQDRLILFFLIPSLVLFSSLSLRDTLVIVFGSIFLINLVNRKYLLSLLFLAPLFILKVQNFSFFLLAFVGNFIFQTHKSSLGLFLYLSSFVIFSFIMQEQILDVINLYRVAFAAEDSIGGYADFAYYTDTAYLELNSLIDFFYASMIRIPNFLFMPLPWNWTSPLYPIQFLESVLLFIILCSLVYKYKLHRNPYSYSLFISFLVGLMIYSVLAMNEGTFVRYRFSFFFPYLIALYYIGYRDSNAQES